MDTGCSRARGHVERKTRQQMLAEGVADRVSHDRGAAVPGEERCLGGGEAEALLAQRRVRAQPRGEARTEGDEAALAELTVTHQEHVALQIDVTALQARDLADAKPEPSEKRENRGVGGPTVGRPRSIGELRGVLEHPADRCWLIEIRQAPS